MRHCTSFAAYKVTEEYKKACKKAYIFEENDDSFVVQGSAMTYVVSSTISSCTCSLFSVMKLPCRHLIFLLLQKRKMSFSLVLSGRDGQKNTIVSKVLSATLHTIKSVSITDVQLLKLTDVSPQKNTKLSRHQKYRDSSLQGTF